ncbi:MAG: Crp/Fnr family transcriptional regulator [Bacillota bacterium]
MERKKVTDVTKLQLIGVVMIKIEQYLDALVGLNLFKDFSKEELKNIFSFSSYKIKHFGKEQIIHLQNEVCWAMDIILAGKVAVQKIDEEGNILTINVFSVPDVIGAHLVFSTNNFYPMTVVSEADTVILSLPREFIIELGYRKPDFMVTLLGTVSDRMLVLADKIRAISHRTIRQQITAFLTYEFHLQKNPVIKLSYSKKELAERLGVQRSSLSRELNKMRREGLLEYDAWTIAIRDLSLVNG